MPRCAVESSGMGRTWGTRLPPRSISVLAVVAIAGTVAMAPPAMSKEAAKCASPNHPGGDWPTYGHDLANTRHQPQEKKIGRLEAATLQPAWTFSSEEVGGAGDFSGTPIITGGCMYVGSNDGWVFAVNADTGKLVWKSKIKGGSINASVGVTDDAVIANVADVGKPYVAAFDRKNGKILWKTVATKQPGSEFYSSPVIFDGLVFSGWSGGAAELGDESDRYRFQGGFVVVDADTGKLLKRTYTIRPPDASADDPKDDFAGGAVWASPTIDEKTKFGYVGAGNPFRPQAEHKNTNAILKIDLDLKRPTFGRIVASYKGTPDEYIPGFSDLPCFDIPGNPAPYYPQGIGQCGDLDMDFGSSPNLWTEGDKTFVGEGQKSGIYHALNADTMKAEWTALVGPPSAVGGIVGSTAVDDSGIYGPITIGGYLWSVDAASGLPRWLVPVADGAHWGNPVSVANGVVYTVDVKGFLDAFDAQTGAPVLAYPLWVAGGDGLKATFGGVSIARNTVYAAVGTLGLPGGFIHAFRAGD